MHFGKRQRGLLRERGLEALSAGKKRVLENKVNTAGVPLNQIGFYLQKALVHFKKGPIRNR